MTALRALSRVRLAVLGIAAFLALIVSIGPASSGDEKASKEKPELPPGFEIDDATREILSKLDAVGPYQLPDLKIKKDTLYAGTPGALVPFGAVEPFRRHFLEQMEYTGPGRAIPEPEHVETVKLGFIGPIIPTVSVATGGASHEEGLGIQMLRGSRLAVEEANARGGYTRRGIPFELVIKNDNGLWGASGNTIVDMAYKDKVWAILGTIDGANSHIAIRVALKAEIFMINTGDTDPTFIETNIPWVARVIGDDRQQGYLMIDYIYRKLGLERVGIIRSSNRYGRFGVREIKDSSRRLGRPIAQEMAYQLGLDNFSLHLERLRKADVQAVVHWGDAREGALILNQMRREGMTQPFFASDRAVSDEFVEIAGANAEGVIAGYPWNPTRRDKILAGFKERFRARFGVEPDTYAAHAYDGMNLLIWATQVAGLNRAKIRDVIAYRTTPWPGVTGEIPLSAALDDVGEVYLAEFRKSKWRYLSRENLGIPDGDPPARDTATRSAVEARRPHFNAREQLSRYAGPGREEAEPEGIDEVRLAYFGPADPDDPLGGDVWSAVSMAVDEANRRGGHRGMPFRLVPVWSKDPWGTGIADLARIIYREDVWAVIGSVDGASTHLAEQVVAKARLPLINPVSTDESVNMANVAWTFSFLPSDDVQAAALAGELLRQTGDEPYVIVSATDHDSHRLARELLGRLSRRGSGPAHHHEVEPGSSDEILKRVAREDPGAVVILAGPAQTARILTALRDEGYDGLALGGPAMGRRAFTEEAGSLAGEVIFPRLCVSSALSGAFAASFKERTGREPDCAAAQSWDATRMLIEAIGRAGLNRARIRDSIAALAAASTSRADRETPASPGPESPSPAGRWIGEAGSVRWNGLGQNDRPVEMTSVKGGRTEPRAER